MDLLETLNAQGGFNAFLASVKIAGAEEALRRPGEWTLFAPTDSAFNRLAPEVMDYFLKSREAMAELVAFHMLPGKVTTEFVKAMPTREMLQDKRLCIERGSIKVNGGKVVRADCACTNGVLHALDCVLLPSKLHVS